MKELYMPCLCSYVSSSLINLLKLKSVCISCCLRSTIIIYILLVYRWNQSMLPRQVQPEITNGQDRLVCRGIYFSTLSKGSRKYRRRKVFFYGSAIKTIKKITSSQLDQSSILIFFGELNIKGYMQGRIQPLQNLKRGIDQL